MIVYSACKQPCPFVISWTSVCEQLGWMGWNGSFAEAHWRECSEAESPQRTIGNGDENKGGTGTTNETEKFWWLVWFSH